MNDNCLWELRLLQIIRVKGNVSYLIDDNHNYTDVIIKINELGDRGFLVKDEDSFILNQQGVEHFHRLCRTLSKRGMYKYFMDATEFRTTSLSIEDIYIPRKRFELE